MGGDQGGFVRLVLWYEVAFGLLAVLVTGSYLADHVAQLRFAIPGALLHQGAILILGCAVWQLQALARIDYSQPVLEIQRRMAALGVVRARANRWLLLSTPLLWAVLVVVVSHGLVGLDVTAPSACRGFSATAASGSPSSPSPLWWRSPPSRGKARPAASRIRAGIPVPESAG